MNIFPIAKWKLLENYPEHFAPDLAFTALVETQGDVEAIALTCHLLPCYLLDT